MTDRESFEAWARKTPRYPVHNPDFKRLGSSEEYSNDWVQADWEVFQAAVAIERDRCLKCYSPDDTVTDYQDKIMGGK
jgi:hypothetical protein